MSEISNESSSESTRETGENITSVASFRDPSEAQMAKGMLEAAGIPAFLQGEEANDLFPGALGVRLGVPAVDEQAALALLSDAESLEETGEFEPLVH
jgi:hypothetical protein